MNKNPPLFVPKDFKKVLVATYTILFFGWFIVARFMGGLTVVDGVGSFISALVISYMVHLWIVYSKKEE
jgi:hypothetical protein